MKTAVIIPARFRSTRLPGKPLLAETGKPLIQHVYERAAGAQKASQIIVATDDERIASAVKAFGGDAVMTSPAHTSGTARIAEVAAKIDADMIINLQGDEPEIEPANIDFLIHLHETYSPFASTLACPFASTATIGAGSPLDAAAVKMITGAKLSANAYRARLFTRAQQPYPLNSDGHVTRPQDYFLHLGLYAFSRASLMQFAQWPPTPLEQSERLEQMRILEHGEGIVAGIIDAAPPGVDTREDYDAFVARFHSQ